MFPGKRNIILPHNTRKIISQCNVFGKTIFPDHLQKISYLNGFISERSSFIFRPKNKFIYSGRGNIISPDNTRKIISQCKFFGKIFLLDHLQKISYFHVLFKQRLSFIFCLENKAIFSRKTKYHPS